MAGTSATKATTAEGPEPNLGALSPLPEKPRVSVIIAALNEQDSIGACLESFKQQDYPATLLELIVADGGSTDSTRVIVGAAAIGSLVTISLVDNPGRTAPSGFNTGLQHATGDVVIVFSAHAIADPAFVRSNVEALRATNAAAVGGPIETRGRGPVGRAIAAAVSHPFGVGNARFRYSQKPGYVDTIAFAAYRKECFDAVGGFRRDRVAAEDDFLNYEIRQAGGQLWLTPEIKSTYFSRGTVAKLARQYFSYGRAKGRAMTQNPGTILPRHLVPAGVVSGGAALALLSLRFGPARSALGLATVTYAAMSVIAGKRARRRTNEEGQAALIALMFPVIHVAYGAGTLLGFALTVLHKRARQAESD